ncbi:MAG: hypothetical protein CMF48_06145 [Legionellales bacterium]|nr:hypothetical protein [Legionellales bacterium]|tara:strand:+ start:22 stop:681 length:660 start_codon:yes stop_codon:yes gene_type:complete
MANLPPNDDINPEIIKHLDELQALRSGKIEDETQIIAKVQQIKALLSDEEALATLRLIRWPRGIVCPRCGSSRVRKRDKNDVSESMAEEMHSEFKRFYQCLDCSKTQGRSHFSDFTGLPENMHPIAQWVLCWYVLGFLSPMKAAQLLGLGFDLMLQVHMSKDLELLPIEDRLEAIEQLAFRKKTKTKETATKLQEKEQELRNNEKEIFHNIRSRPTRWK